MKKIMFNDKYGLTNAVLDGRKTMMRRIVPINIYNQTDWKAVEEGNYMAVVDGDGISFDIRFCGNYGIGEVLAIAQSYKDVNCAGYPVDSRYDPFRTAYSVGSVKESNKGWNNKMFVRADLMPHHIKITDITVERLQDISDEDCLKEGVQEYYPYPNERLRTFQYFRDGKIRHRISPATKCFAFLIDDICGKGTWDSNPWVFAYSFELID